MFQVQRYTQLVAQPVQSRDGNIVRRLTRQFGAIRAEVGSIRSARIPACGIFNFDNFRAEAGENQGGEGSREGDCQIKDGNSFEGLIQAYFSR